MRHEVIRRVEELERRRGELPELMVFSQGDYSSSEATIAAAEAWYDAKPGRLPPLVVVFEDDGREVKPKPRRPTCVPPS